MPIDRAATLRNAEKLLRQGKLEPAIAEYLRVVEDQPRDWNTANTLGDLYARAGQTDKAVEQFVRIAEGLTHEGFLPKAAAIYKKILKLKPDHEHALLKAAEIGARQGKYADARAHLNLVIEKRKARGDARGAAEARIMLGGLDPADYSGRMEAAGARVDIGDSAGAIRDLKEIAAERAEKGAYAEAIEALGRARRVQPDDQSVRIQLFELYVLVEDFARARESANSKEQVQWLAARLEQLDRTDEALDMLREAVRLGPEDTELRAELARALVARGEMASAAEFLTVESAARDPQLLLIAAEIRLRDGKIDEGLALAKRLLDEDPARLEQIALVGWNVAEYSPEAGYTMIDLAATVSVAQGDWAAAAAALQEFVTRVPNHIPALLRLVEICVDGGLDATMDSAQAQLADAYIAGGMAAEARFIAEELVAREPYERANIERFRSALVLLGEADPDTVIAERLSGQSPFVSTDPNASDELPPFEMDATVPQETSAPVAPVNSAAPAVEEAASAEAGAFELSANAVDIESLLSGLEAPLETRSRTAHASSESVEVDLSIELDDVRRLTEGDASAPNLELDPIAASDLDGAFAQLRDEASRRSALDAAEAEYRKARALREQGDIDHCIEALTAASKAPKLRFATASMLGRIYKERGATAQAIEWFEQAVQAPAPSPDDYYALLFELAEGLEEVGEVARALAVCLELQADAGSYRDVDARIDRLIKVQAGG